MNMLHTGLYEQLINRTLRQELDAIPPERKSVEPVDPSEAAEVLSRYIAEAAKRALSDMPEGRVDSRDDVRASAQQKLVSGELRVLFVVDI